jgi:hypothetical protein
MKTSNVIIGLLSAILFVAGLGLYSYRGELNRKAKNRCEKAHSEFRAALYGTDWAFTTPNLEKEIEKACDGEGLNPEETASLKEHRDALQKRYNESLCEDALRVYGASSTTAKQHCPGTQIGKKAGF